MSDTRSDHLFSFAMGEFEATFPLDRLYAKNHMWAQKCAERGTGSESTWRFGLSAYAVRLLQDVYFLDWEIVPPAPVKNRQMIGSIESKKAESDLFAPVEASLIAINEAVLEDPSLINAEPYGEGWLLEFSIADSQTSTLLDPDRYREHLGEAWEVAQRTIKGQANH